MLVSKRTGDKIYAVVKGPGYKSDFQHYYLTNGMNASSIPYLKSVNFEVLYIDETKIHEKMELSHKYQWRTCTEREYHQMLPSSNQVTIESLKEEIRCD